MSTAKSYAQALFEMPLGASKAETLTLAVTTSRTVYRLIRESKELKTLLESPSFSSENKEEVMSTVLKKIGSNSAVDKWIKLIARNGRVLFLSDIANELEKIVAEAEGKLVGDVISSEKIEDAELKSLAQSFEKKMGKPVFLRQEKDENLLAGLKVTIGGLTYDGTLRTQLDRLKERFVEYKTKGMN